jgi:hypothetical protein
MVASTYQFNMETTAHAIQSENLALEALAKGDQLGFEFINSHIPPNERQSWDQRWDVFMGAALKSGSYELFLEVGSLAPQEQKRDWNYLACCAIRGGKLIQNDEGVFHHLFEVIHLFGTEEKCEWNWNNIVATAAETGDRKVFDIIRAKVPEHYQLWWTTIGIGGLTSKDYRMFDYIRAIAPVDNWDWNSLAEHALYVGGKMLFDYIMAIAIASCEMRPDRWGVQWNWEKIAASAVKLNDIPLLDYVREVAPTNHPWKWESLMMNTEGKMGEYIRSLAYGTR